MGGGKKKISKQEMKQENVQTETRGKAESTRADITSINQVRHRSSTLRWLKRKVNQMPEPKVAEIGRAGRGHLDKLLNIPSFLS